MPLIQRVSRFDETLPLPGQGFTSISRTAQSRTVSIVAHHLRGPPEDEAERLWRNATSETKQRIAEHDRRGELHAAAGFRIGPPDRAEIHGDVPHVRPRSADGLRDDACAVDPANRGGGARVDVEEVAQNA